MKTGAEFSVSVDNDFSASCTVQGDRKNHIPLLPQPAIISETIIFMPDAGIQTEQPHAGTPDAPDGVEARNLPFRERCEQWLERSHNVSSPIALELTNVPLWMRQLNDEMRTQAAADGKPVEPITLGSLTKEQLHERFQNDDAVYLINLYAEDPEALKIAQHYSYEWSGLLNNFDEEQDVRASGFAIMSYEPNPKIARDWDELEEFIDKMHEIDKKVIVDFVPNHVGLSHPWARTHPEYFIRASDEEVARLEELRHIPDEDKTDEDRYLELCYSRVEVGDEDGSEPQIYYYAHGKDPYFIPWIDTLQLNYTNPDLQRAMREQLQQLVNHGVDGVRCDMAHLVTPHRFRETWGHKLTEEELLFFDENPFWPQAILETKVTAKERAYAQALQHGMSEEEAQDIQDNTNFLFIAEAYEDKDKRVIGIEERTTDEKEEHSVDGVFDLIYAKDLLDHLHKLYEHKDPYVNYDTVRRHIRYIMNATQEGRYHDIVFLENHDEDRAVAKFGAASKAFAALLACIRETNRPDEGEQGTVFMVHQGQDEGRTIRPRMQMARLPSENPSESYVQFYNDNQQRSLIKGLLPLKASRLFQEGVCTMLDLDPSTSNPSLFAFRYEAEDEKLGAIGAVITINLGNHPASGRIPDIEKGAELSVISMTMRREVERPDAERTGGLYMELSPYEVQIAYYDPSSQKTEKAA